MRSRPTRRRLGLTRRDAIGSFVLLSDSPPVEASIGCAAETRPHLAFTSQTRHPAETTRAPVRTLRLHHTLMRRAAVLDRT